jgi:hypothetical protein
MTKSAQRFEVCRLADMEILDEESFARVPLYVALKRTLLEANYTFRVLPPKLRGRWDLALLLNLTFWGAGGEAGGDVLLAPCIEPDVVTHVAWHHLARCALPETDGVASADALFFGEAIASAFDVYLVGQLLRLNPEAPFLESQVPAMKEVATEAGLSEAKFAALLQSLAQGPEQAFEELRALLLDVSIALLNCADAGAALDVLAGVQKHRFGVLLSRYELSNWVLYARAYAAKKLAPDEKVRALDATLRTSPDSLALLASRWLAPAAG